MNAEHNNLQPNEQAEQLKGKQMDDQAIPFLFISFVVNGTVNLFQFLVIFIQLERISKRDDEERIHWIKWKWNIW